MLDSVEAGSKIFDLIESPAERGMFILHYYWGLTFQEIAYCFNIGEENVRAKIHRAKQHVERGLSIERARSYSN